MKSNSFLISSFLGLKMSLVPIQGDGKHHSEAEELHYLLLLLSQVMPEVKRIGLGKSTKRPCASGCVNVARDGHVDMVG